MFLLSFFLSFFKGKKKEMLQSICSINSTIVNIDLNNIYITLHYKNFQCFNFMSHFDCRLNQLKIYNKIRLNKPLFGAMKVAANLPKNAVKLLAWYGGTVLLKFVTLRGRNSSSRKQRIHYIHYVRKQ